MNAKKQLTDFTGCTPEKRLSIALDIIGVAPDDPKHHRDNLVYQIMLYSTIKKDTEMEAACEKLLSRIRSE